MRQAALTIALSFLLGCGGPGASRKADPPPAGASKAAPAPAAPKPAPRPREVPAGSITRAELLKVHKRGAGHFNAQMNVKATFNRGRFFGWRIRAYDGPGPIKKGDVIINVNGLPIERPDQFMKVWEKLPTITALTVKLLRDGKVIEMSFPVVD